MYKACDSRSSKSVPQAPNQVAAQTSHSHREQHAHRPSLRNFARDRGRELRRGGHGDGRHVQTADAEARQRARHRGLETLAVLLQTHGLATLAPRRQERCRTADVFTFDGLLQQ